MTLQYRSFSSALIFCLFPLLALASSALERSNPPPPNSFWIGSFQAGSTTDIDNLSIVDLDSGTVVYSNNFDSAADATRNLTLVHYPVDGGNGGGTTNYVVNGPLTRVVGGKLRLETVGFGSNGAGGYNSSSDAQFTGSLPKNFRVEFDAVRLQWAGHYGVSFFYRDPTDPEVLSAPAGAVTTNRVAPFRNDWINFNASGSWFNRYGLISQPGADWKIFFEPPVANPMIQHRVAVELSNNFVTYELNGSVLNTMDVSSFVDTDGDGLTDAWERGLGRYQIVEGNFTWQQAEADAEERGGHLATITSAAEESQMIAALGGSEGLSRWSYWIGAYHDGTEWTWGTGEPWSFSNWSPYDDGAGGDQPYGVFFGVDQGAGYESARFFWGDLYVTSLANGYILEFGYPTDPFKADTDGDGFDDKVESDSGTDPNDPSSTPTTPMVTVQGGTLPQSSGLAGTTVSTFIIGKFEVTWREWQEVRAWGLSNGYTDLPEGAGSADNHPVRLVNQFDVVKWCNARSEKEGLTPVYLVNGQTYKTGMLYYSNIFSLNRSANGYRLPTEAEWEWAARGGINSQGFTYSGSDDADLVAWHWDNSIGAPSNIWEGRGSWPVGSKQANELGVHDMSGNVWELVSQGVGSDLVHRFRGGGWNYGAPLASLSYRTTPNGQNVDMRDEAGGFRVARSLILAPLDADNDGVNDHRENTDGTNPNDANSFEPLSKGLVAHYPMNGDSADVSGNGNHAVNLGAEATMDRFGANSRAFSFDGVSAYMDAPPLIADYQRNFTFSGWLKTAHVSSDRLDEAVSALCKPRDARDFGGPALDFREGRAVFAFNNNRVYGDLIPFEEWEYATTDLLADGNWRHYIMSIDANGLITAFINGQQVASHQIATFLEVAGASPFQIGRAGGAHEAGRYFPGQIDDVRVYNRGLSAEEAARLYSESACGLDSDADGVADYREHRDGTDPYDAASFEALSVALIANYPFDNSWKDESGYCRDVLAPYTTFEPGLSGQSLGLAEGNSQANYWNDPNNIESPGRINNFTFSVWMKPATLEQADGAWYHLVSAPNNAAYLRIGNAAGTPGAKVLGMGYSWSGIPGFDYSTPALTSLQESFWQHVVGVQQGVSTAIYVNGRLMGSLVEGQEILFDPENFTIGNLFNKDTFQGQLDEVRIYGRALSPAEVAALYALEVGDLDSDNDGLDDVHETNTGTFVSATDAGTDPYNPDTSGDGILDGEAVQWNFNPLTDHTQVLAFLRHATGVQSGRFALYTEVSIMDLNLGGVMIQKSGSQASVRFKVESKMDLRDPAWSDRGTYLLPPIDMPGSKGFLRIRAEQP